MSQIASSSSCPISIIMRINSALMAVSIPFTTAGLTTMGYSRGVLTSTAAA